MRLLFIGLIALLVVSCSPTPLQKVDSGNKEVNSSLIAIVDGKYKVYKVNGGLMDTVYFVVKDETPLVASWVEDCGEDCTRTVRVQTIQ